jgi:pSer/pThr/pTyr-binding forkhead associated (FHA) protein
MPLSASLARGVAPTTPGVLHARTITGELTAPPRPGLTVRFGRGEKPDVDLGVGIDDLRVSRRHGELTYRSGQWWLRNTGQQLVRLPRGRMMHLDARTAGSGVDGGRRGLAGHCSLRAAVIVCEVRRPPRPRGHRS